MNNFIVMRTVILTEQQLMEVFSEFDIFKDNDENKNVCGKIAPEPVNYSENDNGEPTIGDDVADMESPNYPYFGIGYGYRR